MSRRPRRVCAPRASRCPDRGRNARGMAAEALEPRILLSDGRDVLGRPPSFPDRPGLHDLAVVVPAISVHPFAVAGAAGRGPTASPTWHSGPASRRLPIFNDHRRLAAMPPADLALQVPGSPGQEVPVTFTLTERRARYRNEIGLFRVDGPDGRIGSLMPGDPGYAAAALADSRRVLLFARTAKPGNSIRLVLPAGGLYGMYMIQNGATRQFLAQARAGGVTDAPRLHAFFTFPGGNFDHLTHMRWASGDTVAFEDQSYGGDFDYNDAVVRILVTRAGTTPTPTGGTTATHPPAGSPTGTPTPAPSPSPSPSPTPTPTPTPTPPPTGGGSFAPGLAGWTVHQDGGTPAGQGTATFQAGDAMIQAGNSFDVTLSRPVTIPAGAASLSFSFDTPTFGASAAGAMNDAFEVSLVDAQGQSLVPTTADGRDTFFNQTDGQPVATGAGTSVGGDTVTVDLAAVPAGSAGTLVFRLLHNDGAAGTSVAITGVSAPFAATTAPAASLGGGSPASASALVVPATTPALAGLDASALDAAAAPAGPVTSPPQSSGLSVSVASPADGSAIAPGQTILVSGRASAGGTGRVVSVTVAGTQAEALDAAGDFFTRLTVEPGRDAIAVTAVDDQGHSATATLTINGVAPPAGGVDVSSLADVSGSFVASYGRTSLDYGTGIVYADASVRNIGAYPAGSPLYVAVEHISDPSVHVRDAAGTTADGLPYFDFSGLVAGGTLVPGASSGTLSLAFSDPSGTHFTYDLMFLGAVDHPPAFASVPVVQAVAGSPYEYDASAVSPGGMALTYSLVSGPSGMLVDPATGKVAWSPATPDIGTQEIVVRAADSQGESAEQRFTLTTIASPPNQPPTFSSTPEVSGNVDTPYSYRAVATDPDGDPLTYAIQTGPATMTIDPATGQVTWTPAASQLGDQPISLTVSDGHGGTATQSFAVQVGSALGDQPPVITNQSPTQVLLPTDLVSRTLIPYLGQGYRYKVVPTGQGAGFEQPGFDDSGFQTGNAAFGNGYSGTAPDGSAYDIQTPWPTSTDLLLRQSFRLSPYATDLTVSVEIDNDIQVFLNGHDISGGMQVHDGYASRNSFVFTAPDSDLVPGTNVLAIRARDRGGVDYFDSQVTVKDSTLGSAVGYEHQVTAIDPDGDPLHFQLLESPLGMAIDPTSGLISWAPGQQDIGSHHVTVEVDDGRGGIATQVFDLNVSASPPGSISGVVFDDTNQDGVQQATEAGLQGWTVFLDTNADGQLEAGESFTTTDSSGHYVFNDLAPGTYQVTLVPPLGWIRTAPTNGTDDVTITGSETETGIDFGSVRNPNQTVYPPHFESQPPTTEGLGGQYVYDARASDLQGDPLTYDLVVKPDGMAVDPSTGIVVWTPTAAQLGSQNVILRVTDSQGGVDLQSFQVLVFGSDVPPTITSTPLGPAVAGSAYEYDVIAQSASSEALTYALNNPPMGMAIDPKTGVLTWTPDASQVGTAAVDVVVTDSGGGSADQSFQLQVVASAPDVPPVIGSTPRDAIGVGRTYLYAIQASSPIGSPLTYKLDQAPAGMTVDATGLVTWVPTQAQLGSNPVTIEVDDARGGSATQKVTIVVSASTAIQPPTIISTPPLGDVLGQPYAYNAAADDPQGDPLVWLLKSAPAGMSIDATRGTIRWTPTASQLGSNAVVVEVVDAQGGTDTQSFSINVVAADIPPRITSTPPTSASVGSAYAYPVRAVDDLGLPLTYSLAAAPVGMTIDPGSGLILWTPTAGEVGPQSVTVAVADPLGGGVSQGFSVLVAATGGGQPPAITSTPSFDAIVGNAYAYDITTNEPAGVALTYALLTAPAGMTIDATTGAVSWTPTAAEVGVQTVAVTATDPTGGVASQQFGVGVHNAPKPPSITSSPVTMAAAGAAYRYDVHATDPNGSPLSYSLSAAPKGMTIDGNGRIVWTTAPGDAGTSHVDVVVADGLGLSVDQAFDVTVAPDTQAPTVQINIGQNPANIGDTVTFQVLATDNVGVASEVLTVGGTIVPLDSRGTGTYKVSQAGDLAIVATANDAAGNVGKATATLTAIDPTVTGSPTVDISSPADGTTVTAPTEIDGTVADAHLASWSLDLYTVDGALVSHIAGGTQPVSAGKLGVLDPTLLQSDAYDLRLTATNTGNNSSTADLSISVAGKLKLGNFTLSFTDLAVPVSGIPITVSRTYDTLTSGTSQDFGYGWSLEVGDTNLRTSVPTTGMEGDGIYNPFRDGTRVYITLPGGQREGFTFSPHRAPGLAGSFVGISEPAFTSDPGVTDTLSVTPFELRQNSDGSYSDYGGDLPYNPADPSFSSVYTLTTRNGIVYTIDPQTGKLDSVADGNGNALTFSDAGIFSKSGQKVTFQRDPQGRITAAVDPSGNAIHYAYDAAGDLVSVTDRSGNTTTFDYRTDFPHYLQDVNDPLGRTGARSNYDASGRLTQVTDASGHTVNLGYTPGSDVETTTDPLGNQTIMQYDAQGNVVAEVDPLGGITKKTYDSNNNLLSVTDPLGNTTTYTYDARSDLLTTADPLGRVTRYTYDSTGHLLTTTDPLGHTTAVTTDAKGNVLTVTDPTGVVVETNTYDAAGNLTATTDALGRTTTYVVNGSGLATTITTANGHSMNYTYDTNGNQTGQSTTRTDASGATVPVTLGTDTAANGQLLSVTDPNGNTNSYTYDAAGETTSVVDRLGNKTTYAYDASGNRIKTTYADGTSTSSVYDAANNLVSQTDRQGRTTRFEFDALNRLVKTDYPDGSSVSQQYDAAGRVVATTDGDGHTTKMVYDAAGELIQEIDPAGGVTSYTYDAAGHKTSATDPLGNTTKYVYDSNGQLVETIAPDGSTQTTTYDLDGEPIAVTDQNGNTTHYQYDKLGRLTQVTNALGGVTTYAYDEMGNAVSQTNPLGQTIQQAFDSEQHSVGVTLPLGQADSVTYNAVGDPLTTTDFNGQTTRYTYDSNQRLVREVFADGSEIDFTYTAAGQRATATDARGVTTYSYDARDRLIKVVQPDGTAVSYTYDAAGNRTSVTTPAGTTSYTYDALNRIATVTDPSGGLTTYSYDADSNLVQAVYPDGSVETRTYDTLNRLLTLVTVDVHGTTIQSEKYTYDPAGNRIEVDELGGRVVRYTYDALNRLTEEKITDPSAGNRVIDYSYDAAGNRLTMSDSVAGAATYTYDSNGRLINETTGGKVTTFTYDADGHMLSQNTDAVDQVLYHWDAEGHLSEVDAITPSGTTKIIYAYDADGNRVDTTVNGVETRSLVDIAPSVPQVLEQYRPDGTVVTSYVYGNAPISQQSGGTTSIYHADGIGSVRLLTSASGAVTDTFTYDAFGVLLARTGTTVSGHMFAGESFDTATGLLDLRARAYDPALGQFLSMDPAPAGHADPFGPNRYAYAHDNPVDRIDPSGRQDLAQVGSYLAIAGILAEITAYDLLTLGVPYFIGPQGLNQIRRLEAPDAGLVGISVSVSPSALIYKVPGDAADPLAAEAAIALALVSGAGGFDVLVLPRWKEWYYSYYGLSFGFDTAGSQLSSGGRPWGSFQVYAGLVWNVKKTDDYEGPFWATSGGKGRWGGAVPRGATVFTTPARGASFGISFPLAQGDTPGEASSALSLTASCTTYQYLGESNLIVGAENAISLSVSGVESYAQELVREFLVSAHAPPMMIP